MTPAAARRGNPFDVTYTYRADVLRDIERHGVRPLPHTPPERVRDFVRELYKFEIRRLRERMLRREFPKPEYAARVDELRRAYPVLALLPAQFLLPDAIPPQDRAPDNPRD